jgi:hypothetical protein
MTQINQDGFTPDEIQTAIDVLNETFERQTDADDGAAVVTAKGLVREYKRDSSWRGEKPADIIDADEYQQLGQTGNR